MAADLPPDRLEPVARDNLGALVAESQAIDLLGLRSTLRAVAGAGPRAGGQCRQIAGGRTRTANS
jgi:hypothetical protein